LIKPILIALTVALLLPNFFDVDINERLPYDHKEKFDPALSRLNSIDKLEQYIDSMASANHLAPNTLDYAINIADAIKYRFYHGFSHFTLKENWIAAVSEKVFGYGLSCTVKTQDIMKHEYAACSQQALVMMEILRRKHIDYRNVGFPHHFALEAQVDGKWYYFDPNMEPNISKEERLEENWKCCADNLKKFYDTSRFKDLDWKFGKNLKVTQGKINQTYGANAKIFQSSTSFLSKIMWCFPLLLLFYRSRRTYPAYFKRLWLFLTSNQKQQQYCHLPSTANSPA
jgi:hypothetical protein